MLIRDKETGRFLSKAESEKIIKAKKEAYDKQVQELHNKETKKQVKKTKKNVILKSILIFLAIVLVALIIHVSLQGCEAPRSATMCELNNSWVKCPPNLAPGSHIK